MGLPCFFNRSSVVQRRVCPASSPRAAAPPHCLRPCAGWTASVRLRSCCWPTAGPSWREVRPPNLASSASSCGKGERRRARRCWRLSTPAVRGCECQAVAAAGGVGSRRCWICHCRGGQPCACHPTVMLFIGLPVCPQARHSSSTPNWAGVTPCELQLAPHTHRNAMCSRRGRSSSMRLMRSPPPRHCSSTCNAPAGTELAGGRDGARDEGRQPQATTAANHQPCWRLGFGSPALPRVACSRGCRGLQQLMACCIREPSGEGDRHRPRRCFECCGPMCWHACIANPAHNAPFACDPCSIDWSAPLKLRRSV